MVNVQRVRPVKSAARRDQSRPKLPARLDVPWLKLLVVRGYDNAEIREQLAADDLTDATDAELDTYRHQLVPPANFAPGSEHLASTAFLYRHGLQVHYPPNTHEVNCLLRLLRSRTARVLVETGLLTDVPPYVITQVLREHFGFEGSDTIVVRYRRSFLDIDAVSRVQLHTLVRARVARSVERLVGKRAAPPIIARDPRVMATATKGRLAWVAALVGLGLPPPPADMSSRHLVRPYARA